MAGEVEDETSFCRAYNRRCVTVRQPDTNLRMNHARVYVNRARPMYTYTPGAFTSSVREVVPTLSLHSANSFNDYHTRSLDARGHVEMLHRTNEFGSRFFGARVSTIFNVHS